MVATVFTMVVQLLTLLVIILSPSFVPGLHSYNKHTVITVLFTDISQPVFSTESNSVKLPKEQALYVTCPIRQHASPMQMRAQSYRLLQRTPSTSDRTYLDTWYYDWYVMWFLLSHELKKDILMSFSLYFGINWVHLILQARNSSL